VIKAYCASGVYCACFMCKENAFCESCCGCLKPIVHTECIVRVICEHMVYCACCVLYVHRECIVRVIYAHRVSCSCVICAYKVNHTSDVLCVIECIVCSRRYRAHRV